MNSPQVQPENRAVNECNTRTLNDVRKCVSDLTALRGLAAVVHLIKGYSATRICEVPEQHYADFVDQCEWLMGKSD